MDIFQGTGTANFNGGRAGDLGHRLFARIIGPAAIEISTAASLEAIADGQFDNVRELVLS